MKTINEKRKTAIFIVEHNLQSLFQIIDRAYVLDKGRIAMHDTPENLQKSDILERVFLGKAK